MRKRIICCLLTVALLLTFAPLGFASSGIYFTMINSNTPETLSAGTMPFVRNGTMYVPASTLEQVGIAVVRQSDKVRLSLRRDASVYVVFDLAGGSSVTSRGGSLAVAPLARQGTLFFPVGNTGLATGALASYFGVNFWIVQTSPAPTVRLYHDTGNLSHDALQRNGDQIFGLSSRFYAHTGQTPTGETGAATVSEDRDEAPVVTTPPHPPAVQGAPENAENTADAEDTEAPAPANPVALSFVGITQETAELLDALYIAQIPAGFFLTAADAQNYPDLVRRLRGEGHQIGIHLQSEAQAEFQEASDALFEAARLRTVLVTANDSTVAEEAYDLGLVIFNAPILRSITADCVQSLSGDLLLDNTGIAAETLTALPGAIRASARRVVSFVRALF